MAGWAAARFGVCVRLVSQMLSEARPDVVHITTPPQTHKTLALQTMAAGAHVYVEKPFAVDALEAAVMVEAAAAYDRKLCVGHDQLFDPVWLDCRRRHRAGEFGDIVHIDSVLGYDLSGPFGAQLTEDPEHWVHRLPGGLFQNTISHAIYRITDLMPDARPVIRAHWFTPAAAPFPTDLRVMLQGDQVTASLLFSSRARPVQRIARLYGTRAVAEVNLDAQTVRIDRPTSARGPFIKLHLAWTHVAEGGRGLRSNVGRFMRSEIQFFGGMRRLFEEFYASVRDNQPAPIPSHEILRVTAIMDDIFQACAVESAVRSPLAAAAPEQMIAGGAA